MALVRVYCGLASAYPPRQLAVGSASLSATIVDDAGRVLDVCEIGDDSYGYAYLSALLAERASGQYSVAIAADSNEELVPRLLITAGWALAIVDRDATDDLADRFADDHGADGSSASTQRRALGLARALQAGALAATLLPPPAEFTALKPILAAHSALATGRQAASVALREVLRELYPAALRAYPDPADPVALAVMDALPEPGAVTSTSGRGRDASAATDAVTARLAGNGETDPAAINEAITALRVAVAETPRRSGVSKALASTVAETVRQSVSAVRSCDAAATVLVNTLAEQAPAAPPRPEQPRSPAAPQQPSWTPADPYQPGRRRSAGGHRADPAPAESPPQPAPPQPIPQQPPPAMPPPRQPAAPAPAAASLPPAGPPAMPPPAPPSMGPPGPAPVAAGSVPPAPSAASAPPANRPVSPSPPPPPGITPIGEQQSPRRRAREPQPAEPAQYDPAARNPEPYRTDPLGMQPLAPREPQRQQPSWASSAGSNQAMPQVPAPQVPAPQAPGPQAPGPQVPAPRRAAADAPTGTRNDWPTSPPANDDWAAPSLSSRFASANSYGERPPESRNGASHEPTSGSVPPPWRSDDLQPPEPPALRLVEPTLPKELRDDLGYASPQEEPSRSALPPLRLVDSGGNGVPRSVPPVSADDDDTLLIFAQTRSAWFDENDSASWNTEMDVAWRAAEQAAQPTIGDHTGAGLPRRVPHANLVPGAPPRRDDRPLQVVRDPASIAANTSGYFNGWRRGQEVGGYPLGGRQGRQAAGAWEFHRDEDRLSG